MTTLKLQPVHTRPDYAATARLWRSIADDAQRAGDHDAARLAHFRALENEQFAKQQQKGTK